MIIGEKEKPREGEVEAWTVAIGNLPSGFARKTVKTAKEVLNYAKNRPGFIGIKPCYPHGTLLLYETKDNAEMARKAMASRGIQVGNNICKVFIPKEDMSK